MEETKKQNNIKLVWIATLCTLIVFIFSLSLFKKLSVPYHKDNFTHLVIATASPVLVEAETLYGIQNLSESQASGLAIKSINNQSYILTADHFCQSFEEFSLSYGKDSVQMSGSTMLVYDYIGNSYDGTIVFQDVDLDLCLVRSDMPIKDSVTIANHMPRIGEKVYTVSSPLGISTDGVGLHFEGRFSGCDNAGECFFSIPATFGSSGSIILNSHGEIVAMIQKAIIPLNMISLGVGNSNIKGFLTEASGYLKIDLL